MCRIIFIFVFFLLSATVSININHQHDLYLQLVYSRNACKWQPGKKNKNDYSQMAQRAFDAMRRWIMITYYDYVYVRKSLR